MKNLLRNLFTTFESNTQEMLTPQEQHVADTAINFLLQEYHEMSMIIEEEKRAQKEEKIESILIKRQQYDIAPMESIIGVIDAVIISLRRLSAETSQMVLNRSQSNLAKMMLTPEQMCHVKGSRKFDVSTLSPIHPHQISAFKGNFPPSFVNDMSKVHNLIEQENIFATFAPVNQQLGKSLQFLYIITSRR